MKITESQDRQVRKVIREIILQHDRQVLEEGVFQNAMGWLAKKGMDATGPFKNFLIGLKEELSETKEGLRILKDMAMGNELAPGDVDFLKAQAKDIVNGTVLLGLFALPGGALAATALVKAAKKFGIDMMPSGFAAKEAVA